MYAIARNDLCMTPGKLASQCGHAYVDAVERASQDRRELYQNDGPGTKIALEASLEQLLETQKLCEESNIPCSLIIDSGHVLLPYFTGDPIVTALGIAPSYREEVKFLKSLKLIK